jgi:glutaredoxin
MPELLEVAKPDLVLEWDRENNTGLTLEAIRVNATHAAHWICQTDNRHRWEARVRNRAIDGNGCPYCSGRKTLREESFGFLYPDIAAQLNAAKNPTIDQFQLSPGSNKIVWWKCAQGHETRSSIASRVTNKSGCRKCAYLRGRPSLAETDLAVEFHPSKNGNLKPDAIALGSRKRVWWKCKINPEHIWQHAVYHRLKTGKGCPSCRPRSDGPLSSLQDFSALLSSELHPDLNGALGAADLTIGSSKRVWWRCTKVVTHDAWQTTTRNRAINKHGCPKCANGAFDQSRSIAKTFPELAAEWHPAKNKNLTPDSVTAGSSRKVWWRCLKNPAHEWERMVNTRTTRDAGCPWCSGHAVTPVTSLEICFPKIAAEWHPNKNLGLSPLLVKAKSAKKVWWQCRLNASHEWLAQIKNRTINGSGCPHCAKDNNVLQIQQELSKSAFNTTDVYKTFLLSVHNLELLADSPPDKIKLRPLFFRMLFAQCITTLETYLSDAFLSLVLRDPNFKKKLVTETKEFKERKFTLAEIIESNPSSDESIAEFLSEISWHHIAKAKALYWVVCGVDFPDGLAPLFKAVTNRHDIVHRNGRSIAGNVVTIGDRQVRELFSSVRDFTRELDRRITAI